ncbi:MAG TPA: D-alanyl-D-alanine carboxypeptidase/D-alanyl-D-alanine-endopeptidase [Sulfuricaulis sp.]
MTILFLGLIWLPVAYSATPGADSLPAPVAAVLRDNGFPTRGFSLYVHEIGETNPALAISADVPRLPASTIKLLTTLAALEELGPAWRWKTEAYVTEPVRDGRLAGDLYIKGYGDPYLVIEHFWRFLRALRAEGLETIDGNLILDQGHFEREMGDPADFDNQPLRAYNVLPAALLVNFQAVNFRFIPEPRAKRVLIVADPLPANVEVENRVALTDAPCRGWARALGLKLRHEADSTWVVFSGRYDADCGSHELFRVVSEPAPYILGLFRTLWTQLGGRFQGGVRERTVPAGASLYYTAWSPPLGDIIRSVNKFSNNVMARQMLLTLGAEQAGAPGTTEKGIQAVREWLKRRNLIFPELVLENGAGLSRTETITARHLAQVLLAGWHSPYMPEYISSLAVAAMDGTLRRRFSDAEFEGQMHLKTGSLRDVRSVGGYVLDRAGRRVVVVCLHNHPMADSPAGERVQEAVLKWVHERP